MWVTKNGSAHNGGVDYNIHESIRSFVNKFEANGGGCNVRSKQKAMHIFSRKRAFK